MIPGAREPEEGGLEEADEDDVQYRPGGWEVEGEPSPASPEPDLMGEEGGGGGYGRPREIADEDQS